MHTRSTNIKNNFFNHQKNHLLAEKNRKKKRKTWQQHQIDQEGCGVEKMTMQFRIPHYFLRVDVGIPMNQRKQHQQHPGVGMSNGK